MLDLGDIGALTLSNYYASAAPIHKYSRVSSFGPKEHPQAVKNGSQHRQKGRRIAFQAPRMPLFQGGFILSTLQLSNYNL